MKTIKKVSELKAELAQLKNQGKTIGLVPTMGALHKGHMSLIKNSVTDNDITVASVFVNPTQFNNKNDLETYPRTLQADCELLEANKCDIVFAPEVSEMYPEPDNRVFDLGKVAEVMEGAHRPGHFNGVAQIVSKLFSIVEPNNAYFGEKDFQQIAVIRRMVELENFNINIISCPIVREDDGLATSSRNIRLSEENRKIAPKIAEVLHESCTFAKTNTVKDTISFVVNKINSYPNLEVEYYEIVDGYTMQPISNWNDAKYSVGCITVYCGEVRLIDNICYSK